MEEGIKPTMIVFKRKALKRSLTQQIAEAIEEAIVSEDMQPGARIPPERELAKSFGVTTVTVGEALGVLEQRGLVSRKVGCGTFVEAIPHTIIADSIRRYWVFNGCSGQDLFEMRMAVEPEAAMMAARRASEEDLGRLKRHLDRIEEYCAVQDCERFAEADSDFHEALAFASHNQLFIAVLTGLLHVIKVWIREQSEQTMGEHTVRDHRRVYEAIASGRPAAARKAMLHHMRSFEARFLDHPGGAAARSEIMRRSVLKMEASV